MIFPRAPRRAHFLCRMIFCFCTYMPNTLSDACPVPGTLDIKNFMRGNSVLSALCTRNAFCKSSSCLLRLGIQCAGISTLRSHLFYFWDYTCSEMPHSMAISISSLHIGLRYLCVFICALAFVLVISLSSLYLCPCFCISHITGRCALSRSFGVIFQDINLTKQVNPVAAAAMSAFNTVPLSTLN